MITNTTTETTTVPVKAEGQDWDSFSDAIQSASKAEEARLLEVMPTPAITAERGTPAWNDEWSAQYRAGEQRRGKLMEFNARLLVAIAEAIEAETPSFGTMTIEYSGSGDSGEACDISVWVKPATMRFPLTDEQRSAWEKEREEANALITKDLYEWMDETSFAIAYAQHPGFEIDAGGYGQLVAERDGADGEMTLTMNHTERTETNYAGEVLA